MTMLSSLDLIRRVPLFSMLTDSQALAVSDAVVARLKAQPEVKLAVAVIQEGSANIYISLREDRMGRPCTRRAGGPSRCRRLL